MKRTLIALTCLVILVSPGFSQNPAPPGPPEHRPLHPRFERGNLRHKLEALNLTEEQREKIENLNQETRKKIIPLKAEIELRQVDLLSAMKTESPDEQKILNLNRQIHDLQLKIKEIRIKEQLAFRAILTPEQRRDLRFLDPEPEPDRD